MTDNGFQGYLASDVPLAGLDDVEGSRVPQGLFPVIDAHVHLFPDALFDAVWGWFDRYGWPVRYRLHSRDLLDFLFSRGVDHIVGFQYAHKPGIASELNRYMAGMIRHYPGKLTGMATVFPGEKGAEALLDEAMKLGLKGVKLHTHVQCFELVGTPVEKVLRFCAGNALPAVIHAGREPRSPAYSCDPYLLCSAGRVRHVLEKHPGLKLCVPHLGMDEFDSYRQMLDIFDNLWVDTAMAVGGYLPVTVPFSINALRSDRVMYGSDFPNIPYAWDRELKWFKDSDLPAPVLSGILEKNARDFFGIPAPDGR
ncbi:MAG: amidohydrolase family protein [Pseudomonadota bacterium]